MITTIRNMLMANLQLLLSKTTKPKKKARKSPVARKKVVRARATKVAR